MLLWLLMMVGAIGMSCIRWGCSGRTTRAARGRRDDGSAASTISTSIPPVLDGVIRTSIEMARYFCPFLTVLGYKLFNIESFLVSDWRVIESGLEILVISFSTLFRGSGGQNMRYSDPVCWPMIVDKGKKPIILARRPRAPARRHGGYRFGRRFGGGKDERWEWASGPARRELGQVNICKG